MERAKIVSQTISTFNELRAQANDVFSAQTILPHADMMIEEFFEAKLNPFIRSTKKRILLLPPNDYTIISIDSWIKALNKDLETLKNNPSEKEYAEVVYIQQKYIPMFADELKELKLEILEVLFKLEENQEQNMKNPVNISDGKAVISAGGVAFFIAQLYNFNAIRQDIPSSAVSKVIGPLMGSDPDQVDELLFFDRANHRMAGKSTNEDLANLGKLLRSIIARIENQIKLQEDDY
jgi:hypothetical protein